MTDIFYIAYLKNKQGWGFSAFEKFLKSYEKFPAGVEHNLIILLRGYENNSEEYEKIKEICRQKKIKTIDTTDTGYDFGAYLEGAKQSFSEYIFCMNTTCEIMTENWLKKLFSAVNEKYKLAGVCGSFELCPKFINDFRLADSFKDKIKVFFHKINIFRIVYRYYFTDKTEGFPNYSVRTSAFLIDRNLLIKYFEENDLPKTKLESYEIENGKNSLSKFVIKSGYEICVVDKSGKIFEKENFDKSNTYRSEINNYIIKDRQIENYEKTNWLFKKYLKKICWG
ncbi:hypothetical protein IKQ26_03010 [bacterium]|nr:hypothetical protein [bacterium]